MVDRVGTMKRLAIETHLDTRIQALYHADIMESTERAQLTSQSHRQTNNWWYFYFTPPASLVGLSELSR
jgi:hypothetical protein